jgi:TetR/AcrR family transcriptional regulator
MRRTTEGESRSPASDADRRHRVGGRASRSGVGASGTVVRGTRDAARTRAAILDCAERLFAEKGYRSTSLQEIGEVAGFSRGAPGYFFGPKRKLYAAVVERILSRAEEFFPEGEAAQVGEGALAEVVSRYMDFLVAEPTFVRLMHVEGLDVSGAAGTRALEIARTQLERIGMPAEQSTNLALSIVALCCFPLAHSDTVARALGVDMRSPEAIEAHKRYVTELLSRQAEQQPPQG